MTSWSCHICKFINEPAHLACDVCGEPKQENVDATISLNFEAARNADGFSLVGESASHMLVRVSLVANPLFSSFFTQVRIMHRT